MSNIEDLPKDIYKLFEKPVSIDNKLLEEFKENVGSVVKTALEEAGHHRDFFLRMSNIGLPDRRLWLDNRNKDSHGVLDGVNYFKFLYGHVLESLVLFLAKQAGHDVKHEQREVDLKGVTGHIDGVIDNSLADVKSASPFAYRKFVTGDIMCNDSFGYKTQIRSYYDALIDEGEELNEDVAWVVINKATGEIAVLTYPWFEMPPAKERIEHLKEVIGDDEMPEPCYQPSINKMGNEELHKVCTFCEHKKTCWPSLRIFEYSNGLSYLTKVNKLPRVKEIT